MVNFADREVVYCVNTLCIVSVYAILEYVLLLVILNFMNGKSIIFTLV